MPKVIYNGNGNTGGTVPVDNTIYAVGATVTVLGNTGSLVRNADIFAYWNDQANGLGNVIGGTLTMGAADINLFAAWYTATGLTGGGTTTHYQFRYDSALATAGAGNIEPARTNQLIGQCEADFTWMKGLFNGIELPYPYPVSILVANLGGGAGWGPPITLKGGGGGKDLLRDLMVAEVTEMFMFQQTLLSLPNKGYGFNGVNDEESNGEGLSHYLMEQFEIRDGRPTNLGGFNGNLWLNSSIPQGTAGSTRVGGNPPYDFGSRFDYVNTTINNNGNTPASGCSVLFLWYMTVQLGFNASQLCQAASPTLGGVYTNLTGDNGDPFPFFSNLLANAFPTNVISNIPGANPDNPFPLALLSFWVDKSTFGRDEVQDVINTNGGKFENAFWLVLEGFNKNTFLALAPTITAFTGSFTAIAGISIRPNVTKPVDYENDSNANIPQRIRLAYDIIFTNASLNDFPALGTNAVQRELDTSVSIAGNNITGSATATLFELVSGADPYFTNVNPAQGNDFWLSQDLRVFTVAPGIDNSPFGNVAAGKPVLSVPDTTNLYPASGFQYAQALINYLNSNYSNTGGTDPFSILPGQGTAFSDASSVSRYTFSFVNPFVPQFYQNYNFAIARVRLKGTAGPAGAAPNVRVFFRLWETQTADTGFGTDNYPSIPDAAGFPGTPLPGTNNHTIPFFATGNNSAASDYLSGSNINNRTVQINSGDSVWAYYVCYLNLYDSSNIVNGESVSNDWAVGTHHCLVAQIASDQAPILNSGIVKSPENCDKLAQRNLQLTFSDNPGIAATHRIPQTFDIKRSSPLLNIPGSLFGYPDELMIDWGAIPTGSIANIYWPQVNSGDVISLANSLYANHSLSATDSHTIQCKTTRSVTYVPVPVGIGENLAGLFTVDLPPTVTAGQVLNIIVRKISTHGKRIDTGVRVAVPGQPEEPRINAVVITEPPEEVEPEPVPGSGIVFMKEYKTWRYVAGSFQVRIPVTTKETMLLPEENILAIMKARLQVMSPAKRWYPVLQRYIQYISARVDGLGGDSDSIRPSFNGVVPLPKPKKDCDDEKGKKHECEKKKDECEKTTKCWRLVVWILGGMIFLLFLIVLILLLTRHWH